jgi:hypothetical protein
MYYICTLTMKYISLYYILLSFSSFSGQPKESIPKATMLCTYMIIATSIVIVLVTCSTVDISTARTSRFPLLYGYSALFGGAHESRMFHFLLLPPGYIMSSGFQFAYSRFLLFNILILK